MSDALTNMVTEAQQADAIIYEMKIIDTIYPASYTRMQEPAAREATARAIDMSPAEQAGAYQPVT